VVKVLSLFSGSLASRVATRLVERHPTVEEVYLLHFRSPFAREFDDIRQLVRDEWPGVSFRTQSLKREYRRLIGLSEESFSLSRSCVNCRTLLLARALRYMEKIGAELIVTGEIAGRHGLWGTGLARIAESVGLEGRILRPLCSSDLTSGVKDLLEWADPLGGARVSDKLLKGLALELGMNPYDPLNSSNRCKLTTPGFGDRVADLFCESGFTLNALRLLDFPLYYEIFPNIRIVVAVDGWEKRLLQNLFLPQDLRVYPATPHGPMTLVRTDWDNKSAFARERIIKLASRITATHAEGTPGVPVPIYYRFESEDEKWLLNVLPFDSPGDVSSLEAVKVVPLEIRGASALK